MREGCTHTDVNPCNMPPLSWGNADPHFDPGFFMFVWGFLAAPMLLWTVGMLVVSSRKYQKVRPRSLVVEALLPPTVFAALILLPLIFDFGIEGAISYLSSEAPLVLEYPLIVALYATSIGAVHIYCWFLKSRATAISESK